MRAKKFRILDGGIFFLIQFAALTCMNQISRGEEYGFLLRKDDKIIFKEIGSEIPKKMPDDGNFLILFGEKWGVSNSVYIAAPFETKRPDEVLQKYKKAVFSLDVSEISAPGVSSPLLLLHCVETDLIKGGKAFLMAGVASDYSMFVQTCFPGKWIAVLVDQDNQGKFKFVESRLLDLTHRPPGGVKVKWPDLQKTKNDDPNSNERFLISDFQKIINDSNLESSRQ